MGVAVVVVVDATVALLDPELLTRCRLVGRAWLGALPSPAALGAVAGVAAVAAVLGGVADAEANANADDDDDDAATVVVDAVVVAVMAVTLPEVEV